MKDQLPVAELEEIANVDVGEALRRTRIYYRQSLEDIEAALRIRACQIDAIENGDMDELPGRVYAIGFVRSYAEHMGLDGAKVVQLFKAQYMDGQAKLLLSFPVLASETKTPALWLVVISLLVFSMFFIGAHMLNGHAPETPLFVVQEVPEDIKIHVEQDILVHSPLREEEMVNLSEALPVAVVVENMGEGQDKTPGIILNIMKSSWVEIKNAKGEIIVSNILEEGDQYFVPNSPGLSMSLGNAANVEIILNGRPLKPLGKDGDVRRDIPLDISYLKTLAFKEIRIEEDVIPSPKP
ncbi:MAG: hypothetical protein COB36_00795 [Alphaproteobacteria bacterium]|nr:MAG: hypothetical protein COB36_00795 [Alphaproteobacteria bacterium]